MRKGRRPRWEERISSPTWFRTAGPSRGIPISERSQEGPHRASAAAIPGSSVMHPETQQHLPDHVPAHGAAHLEAGEVVGQEVDAAVVFRPSLIDRLASRFSGGFCVERMLVDAWMRLSI